MPTPQTGTGPGFDSPLPPGGTTVPQTSSGAAVPATGQGSATELRGERDNVQKQLDALQARIAAGQGENGEPNQPSNSEANLIATYNTRIATLTQQITAAEAKGPQLVAGNSPTDHFIIQQMPDGTVKNVGVNPNWDGKTGAAQTVTVGSKVLNVAPDGTITVAYSDADAQSLAQRQTAVAEANAKTAALAQQATQAASQAQTDLNTRVSNGEDAASVRAEQAQQLAQLHEQWVEADGAQQQAQSQLRDYESQRHDQATEGLTQQQIQATQDAQAAQDATTRRGQDISQQTTTRGQDLQSQQAAAATRASLANSRLQAGASYTGNVLSTLAQMNRDAPPGSSAVGNMLEPLLQIGQQFFSQLGGLPSTKDVLGLGDPTTAAADAAAAQATPTAPQVGPTAVTPSNAPIVTAGPTPSNDWYSQWQQRQGADAAQQQAAAAIPNLFPQSGLPEGRSMLPGYATGGIVTKPTVAMVGEQGPEAIVPLNRSIPGLTPAQDFFVKLGASVVAARNQAQAQQPQVSTPGVTPVQAAQQAQVAGQGAAAMGLPPAAAANPMIPGSAVPGVPPAAAGAQARMQPLGPDGTPYATPTDVHAAWAAVYAKHGLVQPGAIAGAPGTSGAPAMAPAGVGG